MAAIETRGLVKTFGSYKAVDNLSLNVPEGSIYGFLGPNGAGKTTTIKMLTGLSTPTEGEIFICGKKAAFGSLKNREFIGYLPDVPNFYDWMTPAEFLRFSGELFLVEKKILDERIGSLLELVGLKGIKKKIGGFSRGMKQRLGIAQALINEPKVIFMDEPTSALDPIGRKEVIDIIATLAGKLTVFFSSHILSDIERVCDRVVILNKGKMMLEDTMENLRHKYSNYGLELELDTVTVSGFEEAIKKEPWAKDITLEGPGKFKIYVNDMKAARIAIPSIISERKLGISKLDTLEPTLEDIFLKVVDGK